MLDGGAEGEVEQPVGMVPGIPPHQIEGIAVDAGSRDELAHRRRLALGGADHGQQQPGVPGIEHPSQHHREPPFVLSLPAEAHQRGQFLGQFGGNAGGIVERNRVPLVLDPVVGLAQTLLAAAGQRESWNVHHRLIAEVDVVHARIPIHGEAVLPGTHHRRDPSVAVGETPERHPHQLPLIDRSDRVGGDEADAAVDGVGHQAVAMEEPLLVAAEGEVVEGRRPVPPHDVPGPELGGASGGQPTVHHRAGHQEQDSSGQGYPQHQQRRVQDALQPRRQVDGLDPDQPFGRRPKSLPPGDGIVDSVGADVIENLDRRGGKGADSDDPHHQRHDGRPQRRPVGARLELVPVDHEHHQDDQRQYRLLDVATGQQVEDQGDRQQHHRHLPGQALSSQDAPAEGDEGQTGEGNQGPSGDGRPKREELEQHVEPATEGGSDGVEDVDQPGEQDGDRGDAPHPAGPAMGLSEIGGGRPGVSLRIGRHHRRMKGADGMIGAEQPLEEAGGPKVGLGQQQADVEVGTGLELDPAQSLAVEEDRGQAQPPGVLLDDLGGGSHVGVEPHPQIGELGLKGGSGDETGEPDADQPAPVLAGGVVGDRLRGDRLERAASEDRPDPTAQESEHHDEHDEHHRGEEPGHLGLVDPVGPVGRPQGPSGNAGTHMLEHPGADGQP